MNFKNEKGSIALFVLIALLFYMGFLLLMYANNLNKVQTITEKIGLTKEIYEKNVNNINEVYNRRLARNDKNKPVIKDIPSEIITNITPLSDSYEEYGFTGGNVEYIAFNKVFTSLKELINYSMQNNLYGNTNIEIKAYGNNNIVTKENKEVEIVRGMIVTNEAELRTAFAIGGKVYIKVANNIACGSAISADNINYRLDLNNSTISYTTTSSNGFTLLTLGANSNLTILDSSSLKQGKIIASLIDTTTQSDGKDRTNSIFTIRNNGVLNLEAGTVASEVYQSLVKKTSGSALKDTATAIDNFGTVNLNGATVNTSTYTNAVVWAITIDSVANARGIISSGTVNLNTGTITVKAEASMQQAGIVFGRTFAYAYGVVNVNGTVNNSNNVTFNRSAVANTGGTFDHGSASDNIINGSRTV